MVDFIDLKKLTLEELVGAINLYPWYGGARRELCARMAASGEAWDERQFAQAAMYVGNRELVYRMARQSRSADLSDREVAKLLQEASTPERKVRAVGGDFFSQHEYDNVSRAEDRIFSTFASKVRSEREEQSDFSILDDFCTESLAQVYAEQGYYEQAKYIYSKLCLRYPEKIAYFAALIEKLDKVVDN